MLRKLTNIQYTASFRWNAIKCSKVLLKQNYNEFSDGYNTHSNTDHVVYCTIIDILTIVSKTTIGDRVLMVGIISPVIISLEVCPIYHVISIAMSVVTIWRITNTCLESQRITNACLKS
jgi:hypothetical protein